MKKTRQPLTHLAGTFHCLIWYKWAQGQGQTLVLWEGAPGGVLWPAHPKQSAGGFFEEERRRPGCTTMGLAQSWPPFAPSAKGLCQHGHLCVLGRAVWAQDGGRDMQTDGQGRVEGLCPALLSLPETALCHSCLGHCQRWALV